MEGGGGSPATFELPFKSNPQPMYVFDPKTLGFLDVNDAALRFYGYRRSEFLRMTMADIRTPVEMQAFTQAVRWRNKPARLSQLAAVPLEGLELAAARTQRIFEKILGGMPDSITRLDRRGNILALNRAPAGASVSSIVGKRLYQFADASTRGALRNAVRRVFATGKPATVEVRGRGDHGKPCWYSNRIGPIMEGGRVGSVLVLAVDVTERRERQRARERERQWLASVVAHAPIILFVNDRNGVITLSEGQGLRAIGLRPGQSVGKSVFRAPLTTREVVAATRRALRGESFSADLPLGKRVFQTTYTPLRDEDGRQEGTIGVAIDITESRRLEQELRASEERYRSLYSRTPAMMHSIDRHGRILTVSDNWLSTLGYERREVIGRRSVDFLAPGSRKLAREVILPAFHKIGSVSDVPYQIRKKNGEVLDVLLSAVAVRDEQGRIERSLAVLVDVTEKRRLEREIADASAREQSKIGRDLHDTVGQTMTGISLLARSLRQSLPHGGARAGQARKLEQLSGTAIGQIRALARGLLPKDIQTLGLGAALEELAQGARELFEIQCSVSCTGDVHVGHDGVSAQLYHIAQEAVHNAARHAASPRGVRIALAVGQKRISLRVTDEGVGLPPLGRRGPGLGLAIMQHRAHSIGGTLAARRRPSGGTEIVCECPRPLKGA